jgi:transposase
MDIKTLTELLNISGVEVTEIIKEEAGKLYLRVEASENKTAICSHCEEAHERVHSTAEVIVEDLRASGKRVFLVLKKRKLRCPKDGQIHVEKIDWIMERFTKRFAEDISRLTAITTNQEAGWYLGLNDEKVYRIDKKTLEAEAKKN